MSKPKLIIVGGLPGTGKTVFGKLLAQQLKVCYLDKDTLTTPLVHALLEHLPESGGATYDRDSDSYIREVRPAEYDCMMDQAFENLKIGNSVLVSAPFYREVRNQNWIESMKAATEQLGKDLSASLHIVWLTTPPELAQARLTARSAPRDKARLANWDKYLTSADYSFRPAFPHINIRNGKETFSKDLIAQVVKHIETH